MKFRARGLDGGELRAADGGFVFFGQLSGTCNGCGTCRFLTGGVAGYAAPQGCVQEGLDPGCCDRTTTCVWTY